VASLEVCSFVWKLVESLLKPQGFTNKFTEGVGCPKWVGNQVPRGFTLLHTLPLGIFLRIETTTIKVSLIRLLHTNNFGSDESQDRDRLARVKSIYRQLRGRFILQLETKLKLNCIKLQRFSNY
jgi:hypothetical protein